MRLYCVFCIFLTFVRWKNCSIELQSDYISDDTTIDELQGSVRDADMITVSPFLRYSIHDSDQNKGSPIPVSIEPFDLETELAITILSSTTAPNVVLSSSAVSLKTEPPGFVPSEDMKLLNSHEKSEMLVKNLVTQSTHNNAPPTSLPQPVPSELTQTSLADANLMPKANPISARMLNMLPDIIMTSPINSPKNVDEPFEIHATPTVANSRMETPNSSRSLESNVLPEHDIAIVPNNSRPILQANGTESVRVGKRTNSHTMVIVPAVIGVISVLSVGIMAALYQWHQRGRRRKVYLSHPGAPPKDFAEDTGVRSPVLLPEEIEMQVGRSQSLRVRRAVILATDPPVIEADSITVNVDSVTTVDTSGDPITNSTPPPPPYREPPPYLPDMVIENIHAL